MTKLQQHLADIGACPKACKWAGDRTPEQAWNESPRADWLLWWAGEREVDRRKLVRAACLCARRALRFVPAEELRPLKAIETAEAWCEGKATPENTTSALRAQARAEAAAAAAAAAWEAEAAAWAAAWAAEAWEAEAAARAAARAAEHLELCKLVRSVIPFEDLGLGKEEVLTR